MGILNVTPDSFSDGGRFLEKEKAVNRALRMKEAGAAIVDIGGESTRPGASPVSEQEEISRVIPVIEEVASRGIPVSCDTSKPGVAREALRRGAVMINDVRGFSDPEMREGAAGYNAAVCVMHMKGTPRSMQSGPRYENLLSEIREYLHRQASLCREAGIPREEIFIDPGVGFGKTLEHNLELIANADFFTVRHPVLMGVSRKSFIGMISGLHPRDRLGGSVASACWLALKGVDILRVHDVKETVEALKVIKEIRKRRNE